MNSQERESLPYSFHHKVIYFLELEQRFAQDQKLVY